MRCVSEHPNGTARPCCMFLELAGIASGRLLEDVEDERIAEEGDPAAAVGCHKCSGHEVALVWGM